MEGCKCTGCQVVKDITEFYKNNKSKTGKPRQPCKDCSKIKEAKKREEYRENSKNIPPTKVCSVCLEEKSSEDFHKRLDTPTGLRSDCKDCYNNKSKVYYEGNAEKVIARTSEYQKIHREKLTRRKREKYQEDPESAREKDREWRRKNPDKVAQYSKAYRKIIPKNTKGVTGNITTITVRNLKKNDRGGIKPTKINLHTIPPKDVLKRNKQLRSGLTKRL